jgi:glycosyltransferase involved in cell wall biosynthesis
MKVVHVITGLRIGGAETQLRLLLQHTATDPMVVALTNADEVAEAIRSDGVPVAALDMRSNHDLAAIGSLAGLLRRHRPDVVHLHLYRATLYGRVAAAMARVPVVVTTEHSLHEGDIEGRRATSAVRALYVATEPLSSATIAVSDEVARRLVAWGVSADKVTTIPNGIDFSALANGHRDARAHYRARIRRELEIPDDAQVVGGVGRLSATKRWDLLIRALADDLGPRLQMLLLGAGEEECPLRHLADSLGVGPWVHLPGASPDVLPALAAMDVVASPAPQETFGLAVAEAAAAGLPVVYVHCPALEVLGHLPGVTRTAAQPQALRDALLAALASADRPPRSALDRYDIRTTAQQVDGVYERCRRRRRRT